MKEESADDETYYVAAEQAKDHVVTGNTVLIGIYELREVQKLEGAVVLHNTKLVS